MMNFLTISLGMTKTVVLFSFFFFSYAILVIKMKRIRFRDYHESMGTLIDLSTPDVYEKRRVPGSINMTYDKLMLHYQEYLKKDQSYYILCTKGIHSKRAVSILEYYGYDVTQVYFEEE